MPTPTKPSAPADRISPMEIHRLCDSAIDDARDAKAHSKDIRVHNEADALILAALTRLRAAIEAVPA